MFYEQKIKYNVKKINISLRVKHKHTRTRFSRLAAAAQMYCISLINMVNLWLVLGRYTHLVLQQKKKRRKNTRLVV